MTMSVLSGIFSASVLGIGLSSLVRAQVPAPNMAPWENEPLKLRLFYPSDLVPQDASHVMSNGRLTLFGISGAADSKLAAETRCLHPMLLLELPHSDDAQTTSSQLMPGGATKVTVTPVTTATIVLSELDVNCLNGQQSDNATLLADLAELVDKAPGMTSIAPPSTYTIGWQKVHMAAAQGQPQPQPDTAQPQLLPQQLFTMGISTNWNSHLLVWYFSSNSIDMLNRITKTTVRFGRAQAAPLYPIVIGTAGH